MQAASTRRPPPAEISRVLVRADYLDDDRQLATIELEPTGDGQWELLDPVLSSPGNWKLEVVIRREGLVDQKALFDWPIPLVEPREPLVSDGRWTDLLTGVAIVGLGAIGLVAALTFVRHQRGSER
ncbi:MAG: hypothetical protein GY773_03455 [Actinomycetia bacterium]|nr:hypothetical protein [Actinomycetes bacterium]